jgi:hypothetical protein
MCLGQVLSSHTAAFNGHENIADFTERADGRRTPAHHGA